MNRLLNFNILLVLIFGSVLAVFSTAVPSVFAADTLLTAEYIDADRNGIVDHLKWTFDSNLTACNYEASDWTVNTPGSINITITGINTADPEGNGNGVCDGTDAVLYLSVTTVSSSTGGVIDPVVSYANQGNADDLQDSGNISAHASIVQADGAAPIIRDIKYYESDATPDGKIDSFKFTFSERVSSNSFITTNNFTITDDGDFDGLQFHNSLIAFDLIRSDTYDESLGLIEAVVVDTKDDSGTLAISMQGTFSLEDFDGNINTEVELAGAINPNIIDGAAPFIKQLDYEDSNGDGMIDSGKLTFSELVRDSSVLSLNDLVFNDVGDFTGLEFGTDTTDLITLNVTSIDFTFGTASTVIDTSEDSGTININGANLYSLTDGIFGTTTSSNFDGTSIVYADAAAPVIVTVSPEDGGEGSRLDGITLTFSEAMDTTFVEGAEFNVSPDPGTFTVDWSENDSVVNLNSSFTCNQDYRAITREATIDAASGIGPTALVITGPEVGDWDFTTTCSGSSDSVTPLPTYEALLLSPNGGEELLVGDITEITWSTGGTGLMSLIDLLLSTDDGATYSTLVEGEVNDGSYTWTVPNLLTTRALVKIEGHNNLAPLATDDSDTSFSIVEFLTGPVPQVLGEVSEPATGSTGPSPVTGLMEEISVVNAGDLIRSEYFDTVYYIDNDMVRHPFFNETIYATWYSDFDDVKIVTDATLPIFPLGTSMLPKPGVTWVKIQSIDKIYLVETNPLDEFIPTLRWVSSESLSEELLGSDWADYVIDIDVSLFGRFNFGADVLNSSDVTIDMDMMKKRTTLNI